MDYSSRLNKVIPGGAHTYSRGDDQYPQNAPHILSKGKGSYVWDAYENKFLDYGMALRSVTVGYGYEPIAKAAYDEILKGNNLTRASIVELEAAELLCDLIGTDMVKFAKNGSTVNSAALKLSRAYTGKKYTAVCAQHSFFSFDDWFIGTTPITRGIPNEFASLTLKFDYNSIESLEKLFQQHPNDIAAVMLEPCTTIEPKDNFLHKVKEVCEKNGAVFILDEMITGFRWHLKGAQHYFNIKPDLCTFGKGMANGFSVAALAGKKEIMNLGGIKDQGTERVFLISTTHGAEMCGLGAFIETVHVYNQVNVTNHIWEYGKKLIEEGNKIATHFGIDDKFYFEGYPCSPNYVVKDKSGAVSLPLRTLFSQEMIKQGVLMPWVALSYMHKDTDLDLTLSALRETLKVLTMAIESGHENFLKGNSIKPIFRQFN